MASESSLPWMALSLLPVTSVKLSRALTLCGGDPSAALSHLAGLETASRLQEAARLRPQLAADGITPLTQADSGYPALLLQTDDPPPVLYLRGQLQPEDDPAVAVVGSRHATAYGQAVARYLGRELGTAGVTVVSGLARGIDAAAHHGLLATPAGRGLAVLGNGLGSVYPPEHRDMARDIARRGALISEFPPLVPPLARNFPRRNRLISGLARAVVVVEAAPGSGSLITARLALEQGRELLAVPGPITARTSRGTNDLLAQGARPVASALEIVQEFPATIRAHLARRLAARRAGPPPDLSPTQREIWLALDAAHATSVEELSATTHLGVSSLVSALLALEVRGMIRVLPGPRYIRGDWTGPG